MYTFTGHPSLIFSWLPGPFGFNGTRNRCILPPYDYLCLRLDSNCKVLKGLELFPQSGQAYCCWKQVELNTIASGFGWMGPASGMIHRLVYYRGGDVIFGIVVLKGAEANMYTFSD